MNFKTLFSPQFDVLHSSPIDCNGSYEKQGTYLSGYTFILNQEGPRK